MFSAQHAFFAHAASRSHTGACNDQGEGCNGARLPLVLRGVFPLRADASAYADADAFPKLYAYAVGHRLLTHAPCPVPLLSRVEPSMPAPRRIRVAALVLAAAVLAGTAAAAARPPLPNRDYFAYAPLDSEDSGDEIVQANMCEQGYKVAGIVFG